MKPFNVRFARTNQVVLAMHDPFWKARGTRGIDNDACVISLALVVDRTGFNNLIKGVPKAFNIGF